MPFLFEKEIRIGEFVETIGRVGLEYRREMAEWLWASNELGPFDDALLAYAVTTDEVEAARQSEREERVEAARSVLADRARRRAAEGEAPAPDDDQAANRSRSRQRAHTQHEAPAPPRTVRLDRRSGAR